jgi:hypothetical protein
MRRMEAFMQRRTLEFGFRVKYTHLRFIEVHTPITVAARCKA